MRITAVSTDAKHLSELSRLLRERSHADEVTVINQPLERLLTMNDLATVDVMVLVHRDLEGADVDAIERLGFMMPHTAFILMSPLQTPEFLMQAMRAGIREVVPSPPSETTLYPALRRIADKLDSQANAGGKILAFVSCKGGSGATFLASNLGYALAELEHKRVALLDLNLQFGDAALFVSEQKPMATLADVAKQIHRLDPSFLAGSMVNVTPNFSVLAAPEDPSYSEDVKPEHIDVLLKLARRHYDFVLLDVGRSLDSVSVRALDLADKVFPILQTTLPYIRDGKRLLGVFRSLDYSNEKVNIIVNRHENNAQIQLKDLAAAFGTKHFITMPNHYSAAEASVNQGVPIQKLAPTSPLSKALANLAHELCGGTARPDEEIKPGLFKRLLNNK